jgi:hypothetical protein
MEIIKGLFIENLAIRYKDCIIIGDLQLGFEAQMISSGTMLPRSQEKDILSMLSIILNRVKPKHIIINGDLKHDFAGGNREEKGEVDRMLKYLKGVAQVTLMKGNHDTIIDTQDLSMEDHLVIDDILVCHGHKLVKTSERNVNTIVISHVHPAIYLREGARVEKYKCFLRGKYKDKDLIVLPSFNPLAEGTDVLNTPSNTPYIGSFDDFETYAISDKVFRFGKVNSLRSMIERI